jgi:hypothetical protein
VSALKYLSGARKKQLIDIVAENARQGLEQLKINSCLSLPIYLKRWQRFKENLNYRGYCQNRGL